MTRMDCQNPLKLPIRRRRLLKDIYTQEELKKISKELSLPISGNKTDLCQRIAATEKTGEPILSESLPKPKNKSKMRKTPNTKTPRPSAHVSSKTPKMTSSESSKTPKQMSSESSKTPKQMSPESSKTPKQTSPESSKNPKQTSPESSKTPVNIDELKPLSKPPKAPFMGQNKNNPKK